MSLLLPCHLYEAHIPRKKFCFLRISILRNVNPSSALRVRKTGWLMRSMFLQFCPLLCCVLVLRGEANNPWCATRWACSLRARAAGSSALQQSLSPRVILGSISSLRASSHTCQKRTAAPRNQGSQQNCQELAKMLPWLSRLNRLTEKAVLFACLQFVIPLVAPQHPPHSQDARQKTPTV